MANHKPGIRKFEFRLNFGFKNILIWGLVIFLVVSFILSLGVGQGVNTKVEVQLSQALTQIKDGKVREVQINGEKITLVYHDGSTAISRKEAGEAITGIFKDAGIDPTSVGVEIKDQSLSRAWGDILSTILPLVFIAIFFFFILRQARGAQESIFSFGQSRARVFDKGRPSTTFADVAGVDEAKKELEEVVDFLKHPGKYFALGARTPKGVLLFGPSGVGKTLLARAVAGEAGVPFFSMAGSEFMEMLVGVGASVTGDTPILIKHSGETKLLPIGEFVDSFCKSKREGIVLVDDVYTLGFESGKHGFWGYKNGKMQTIKTSAFKKISSVYRHKVNEIYEIHYLGGMIRATADHSVFIRKQGKILSVATKDIKKGDVLVELPLNVRLPYIEGTKQRHKIIAHGFPSATDIMLDVWNDDQELKQQYEFAISQKGIASQYAVAQAVGVSQATVGHWQNGIHSPRLLSKKTVKLNLPSEVAVTPSLMKLFGYYAAEGRGTNNLEFTFGVNEANLHHDLINLMHEAFGITPVLEKTVDNTLKIKYYSAHLGRFFTKWCGNGSHNKHVPEFLWDLPKEYFLAFLEGYWRGDGYQTKSGKLSMTSVSRQLILELSWLCSLHGMKVGIKEGKNKAGRIIKNKPLPETHYWCLIIGKTTNPFLDEKVESPFQFKRAIVQKVIKRPYDSFVYDLCGVENEAFFGGEKPVLLHNSRVRDLFSTAKKAAPSIIFIDEIDAIGRQRGAGMMGGHDEREQTLNQILVEMDGFTPNDNVIVLAATNRGDLLDPALLRPGRFDRRVILDMPDIVAREAILKIHARGKPFGPDVVWERVAKKTVGSSGADLENMLNEAAILAARENKKVIDAGDIDEASLKVKLGPAKKRVQSDEDKSLTAYHEAGHALVSYSLSNMDPVSRISIVARGVSLGHTLIPPGADRTHETKSRLLDQIVAVLGGRTAESMIFNELTTGAANDIAQATQIARRMVVDFGMSSLGPINFGPQVEYSDMGRALWMEPTQLSPEMAAKVDREVKKIIDECSQRATEILKNKKKQLDMLAKNLLEKETIEQEEFERLMKNEG